MEEGLYKICTNCNSRKLLSDFQFMSSVNRYVAMCRSCIQDKNIELKYGLTRLDYELILNKQEERCAICRNVLDNTGYFRDACVDHDHSSGNVRGILCKGCNNGLGAFRDSIPKLEQAISYLYESKKTQIL